MQRFKYWYTSVISCPDHKISKPRLLYRQLDHFLKNPDVMVMGKKHSYFPFCPEENSFKSAVQKAFKRNTQWWISYK